MAKQQIFKHFYNMMNKSNKLVLGVDVTEAGWKTKFLKQKELKQNEDDEKTLPKYMIQTFKFFVGYGNNYPLVRQVVK